MNTLGKWLLGGLWQSAGLVSLLTIISLLSPPFSYLLSGAPVGLVTLRKGPALGLQTSLGALLLVSLFGQFAGPGAALGPAIAVGIWGPVWVCSLILRGSESQGVMLQAVAVTGIAVVLVSYLYDEQLTAVWQSWRDRLLEQGLGAGESDQVRQLFDTMLPFLNGIVAAGFVISLVCTVLFARWWQARLFNPGGFREEFRKMLLPRWLPLATLVLIALGMVYSGDFQWPIRALMLVLIVVHVFQGIASVHRIVAARGLSSNWLIAMYVFLLVLPQMALFIACIGMIDAWRRRLPPAGVI